MEMAQDQISKYQSSLLDRMNSIQGFFNRNIFRMYQQKQLNRWESQNVSETGEWETLTETYANRKRKKFAGYPGGGTKLMIATGKLYETTTGRSGKGLNKMVTNRSMTIAIDDGYIPYAKFAAERRPIMEFNESSIEDMRQALIDYIKGINQ